MVDVALRGSYLCPDYELRVTGRCLAEDLNRPAADPFRELASHEIITAFINRRRASPEDTRQVAPLSTGRTVYRLAYGDRHRGATWYDEAHGVVWLLAYAQHEFADAGDAFPYFKELDAADRLLPVAADYEALFVARDARLAEVVAHEGRELLNAGRSALGTEIRAVIAAQIEIGLAIDAAEDVEEVTVAIKYQGLTPENLPILLAALFPNASAKDLENPASIAGRSLGNDEIAYRAMAQR